MHADDDERSLPSSRHELREPRHALVSEDRLVDDRHGGRNTPDQAEEVAGIGRRRERLDARLGLEQTPQSRAQALVPYGEEDGDGCGMTGCEAQRHDDKHRPVTADAHPGGCLIRPP
jgi:hypothetical protein